MPPARAGGPAPPWVQVRHLQDRLTDPPRRAPEPTRCRDARPRPDAKGRCRYCRRLKFSGGDSCGRRACPGFIGLWLADQRVRLWLNLLAYGRDVALVTVTAPGVDEGLVWDRSHCSHAPDVRCSGKVGCRVLPAAARAFNRQASASLSKLHDAAAQAVRRKHGPGALALLAYAPELQARGVVHWHVLLGVGTPRERGAAQHYVNNLSRLAPAYGYGYVDRGRRHRGTRRLEVMAPWRAATYASKYLVKQRGGVGEMVVRGEAPERPVYVARRLTNDTRCTMRNLRLKRAIYCRWGETLRPRDAELVWSLVQTFDAELVRDPETVGEVPNAP